MDSQLNERTPLLGHSPSRPSRALGPRQRYFRAKAYTRKPYGDYTARRARGYNKPVPIVVENDNAGGYGYDEEECSETQSPEPCSGPDHSSCFEASAIVSNSRASPLSRIRSVLVPQGISLTLQNSGSVARDHLASERTFLAYMRTSLAIVSSGVALVQLFTAASSASADRPIGMHRLHAYVRPLGATTITLGLFVLFIGVARFFTVQSALTKGLFPVARVAAGVIAFGLAALVTATFGILVAGKLEPKVRPS